MLMTSSMPSAVRAHVPRHFATHGPHELEARCLQRRREPEDQGRHNGASHQEHEYTPIRCKNAEVQRLGDFRGHRRGCRVKRTVLKQPGDCTTAGRGHEREEETFREQLPDDTLARRSDRQPDADLALTRDTARQEQVRDVGAANHQDHPEGEEDRHEDQRRFVAVG